MFEAVESIKDNNYTETNKSEVVFRDNQQMCWEEVRPEMVEEVGDNGGKVGRELVESGWFQQKRKLQEVLLRDFDTPDYSIVQGGIGSGIRKCVIVSNNDVNITSHI